MIVQRHERAGGNLPSQTQYAPRVSRFVIFSLTAAPSKDSSLPSLDIMCRGMGLFGDSIGLDGFILPLLLKTARISKRASLNGRANVSGFRLQE